MQRYKWGERELLEKTFGKLTSSLSSPLWPLWLVPPSSPLSPPPRPSSRAQSTSILTQRFKAVLERWHHSFFFFFHPLYNSPVTADRAEKQELSAALQSTHSKGPVRKLTSFLCCRTISGIPKSSDIKLTSVWSIWQQWKLLVLLLELSAVWRSGNKQMG